MSGAESHTSISGLACRYVEEHPRIGERLDQHEKRLDVAEPKIDRLSESVAEIRGAWKLAVVLGTAVGSIAGGIAAAAVEALLRAR